MEYSELQVTSNFSFLRGGSHPQELVEQANAFGYTKIAITDRNSLAGIVRAHVTAKEVGIGFIPGCRLDLLDGPSLLAYPTDQTAYSRLSALLTTGNLRAEKGECHLYKADVFKYAEGMIFIVLPPDTLTILFDLDDAFKQAVQEYKTALGGALYVAASRTYNGDDAKKLFRLSKLGIPMVATNDVHYHASERRELQDVLTCVREKCTIHNAGFKLYANAERYLKPIDEMHRLFRPYPEAIENTTRIAEACKFSLDSLKYVYPEEISAEGVSPQEELTKLTWEGAKRHFGDTIPKKVKVSIEYELDFIQRKGYASYFLTVYDYVRYAREQGILCQGRGSAANSVVCFCLGITSVNPSKFKLLFARFMSDARDEPPDIDVDFEHERREEVIQYIYNKYGRDRSAIVATVMQERQKGSVRDVGKAMGLSEDVITLLSSDQWELSEDWFDGKLLTEKGLNPNDPHILKVLQLTKQLMGFPRQLGQHTGGFVMTQGQLSDLCPIMNATMENRTCIEWNKDDIDALGFLKVDVLALGMLSCIRKAFDLAKDNYGLDFTLANIPQDDPKVYNMISHADTVGVFQIESRAQMSMLPRMKPKVFYDLVIEVAIVRPGPIQGDMVHPYLKRRNGEEPVIYPSKELEDILGRTLGVPLFQEQAMEIAIVAGGFTPAEADELRRSMATFKADGRIHLFEAKLVEGMVANGYDRNFAERVFKQLKGFSGYGFPESHAVSFALLVYVSCWFKCYYPDIFLVAILNSLPMGFYQPAQLVRDARNHGVKVRPADINYSVWDNITEEKFNQYYAVRLGFRNIDGLELEDMTVLVESRQLPYKSITELRDVGVSHSALEKLADADTFRSIGLDRRQALWEVSALHDRPIALFKGQPSTSTTEAQIVLPLMTDSEHVVQDYATTSLSLKAHPVSFLREKLTMLKVLSTAEANIAEVKSRIKVSGLVLVRQRPGTAKGVCFITIEDETSQSNLVVFPNIFDRYRKEILQSKLLMVEGIVQREGEVVHIIVARCYNLTKLLRGLTANDSPDLPVLTLARADETSIPAFAQGIYSGTAKQKEAFDKGRNFR